MISVKNLTKVYDLGQAAVDNVSFDIDKGEIIGLLGPNGAGKTTIMRMISCYMNPTDGEILVDGINTMDDPKTVKNLIGYLPEHTPQYENMIVHDYLEFIAELRGIPTDEIPAKIKSMIKMTSLEKVIFKKIGQLSKGYRKRVGLASVLIHDPEILILDEPTTGLDPNQIITFRKMLRKLSQKKTVILSTHILSEIEATCERVVIINNGKVVANDSMQTIFDKYDSEQFYEFTVKADDLITVENELNKVKSAWKMEFLRKIDKTTYRV
jgi:ABC-2 type transport system ATP-binding protein